MKRSLPILLTAILLITAMDASGQRWKLRRYEADFYVGGVAFHGDIGLAARPFANMFNGFRPSFGITPRYMLRQDLALSLDLAYVAFGGVDEEGSTHRRNFSFNANAFQHYARIEYFLVGTRTGRTSGIYNRRGMVNNYNRVQIYVLGGVGGILSKANVKDLDNDGQPPDGRAGYYPGLQYGVGFPFGGGIKFSLDPRWSLGIEATYTFTLTDKLDSYAPSFSDYNDTYYLLSVKGVYRLRNDRNGRPLFNKYYR